MPRTSTRAAWAARPALAVPALLAVLVLLVTGCADDAPEAPADDPATAADASSDPGQDLDPNPDPDLGTSPGEASVTSDVVAVTPPLEQYFFSAGYARTLDEALAALAANGLELTPGNRVGSYVLDEADEEFRLCVENDSGAFATYDTSPMSVLDAGATGGCPQG